MLLQILFYPLPITSFPQIKNNPYRKIIIPSLPHPTTPEQSSLQLLNALKKLFTSPFTSFKCFKKAVYQSLYFF